MSEINYEALRKNLDVAIDHFYDEEAKALDTMYSNSPQKVRELERDELIRRSINIVPRAQKVVEDILNRAQVPYVSTVWSMVTENISEPPYIYVDWHSIENENTNKNLIEMPKENLEENRIKDTKFPITGVSLVTGTIAGIGFMIGGKPIIALVLVIGSVLGGQMVRILRMEKSPSKVSKNEKKQLSSVNVARDENKKILADWCSKLKEVTVKMCKENEE